jgi:GMP synthase-like glutamine amidotransferase
MRIGILETGDVAEDLRRRHGDYPSMFARLLGTLDPGLDFVTFRAVAGELPEAPGQADAWLVTGSRHGVYDDLPWIEPLKAFLRAAIDAGVPVVGICFGHQLLAEALGGRAEKSPKGWGLGIQEYRVTHRPSWLEAVPDTVSVHAIHQDQVTRLPPDATVLAASAFCPYAALAYGDPERPRAISVQPHPEFSRDFLSELIDARAGTVIPEPVAAEARASLGREPHSEAWARAILDYLRQATATRDPAR